MKFALRRVKLKVKMIKPTTLLFCFYFVGFVDMVVFVCSWMDLISTKLFAWLV
jgi:hypothetical protein